MGSGPWQSRRLAALLVLAALTGCGSNSSFSLPVSADPFEPNDAPGGCTLVALDFVQPNLSIHDVSDQDYFCFIVATISDVDVTVEFAHASGDIDVELLDSALSVVAESRTTRDREIISETLSPGQYRVRVFSPSNDANGYGIEIRGRGSLSPDIYETNNDPGSCAPVNLDFSVSGLTIDVPFDEDFFCFTLNQDSTVTVTATFVHADGNIDIMLLDPVGSPIAESRTLQGVETITLSVPSGQFFVRVWSSSGETNVYDLDIQAQ